HLLELFGIIRTQYFQTAFHRLAQRILLAFRLPGELGYLGAEAVSELLKGALNLLAQASSARRRFLAQHFAPHGTLLPPARKLVAQPLLEPRQSGRDGLLLQGRVRAQTEKDDRGEPGSQDRSRDADGWQQLYRHRHPRPLGGSSRRCRELSSPASATFFLTLHRSREREGWAARNIKRT